MTKLVHRTLTLESTKQVMCFELVTWPLQPIKLC